MTEKFIATGILLLLLFNLHAQRKDSVDVWKMVLKIVQSKNRRPDGDSSWIFNTFSYYVHNNLVLRRDTPEQPIRKVSKTTSQSKALVQMKIAITQLRLVYLIDLQQNLTYTFCKNDSLKYIVVDSLKNHPEDFFYKVSLADSIRGKLHQVQHEKEELQEVAGYKTTTVYSSKTPSDTVRLQVSVSKLPFSSPLNAFYPDVKNAILEICSPMKQIKNAQNLLVVTEAKMVRVPMDFFQLHKELPARRNVPYATILLNIIDPF